MKYIFHNSPVIVFGSMASVYAKLDTGIFGMLRSAICAGNMQLQRSILKRNYVTGLCDPLPITVA